MSETFTAAPVGGANVYIRSTRAPAANTGTGRAGHVGGHEVAALQHAPEQRGRGGGRQAVEHARELAGELERGLGAPLPDQQADRLHAVARIRDRRRDGEACGREVIARGVVALAPEVDRQRHPQRHRAVAVALVVAIQPAHDGGDEHVVEAAFGRLRRAAEVVEGEVEHVEAAPETAVAA